MTKVLGILGIGILLIGGMAFLPRESETPPAPTILHCPYGNAEDSCDMDYLGNGDWTLKKGSDQ